MKLNYWFFPISLFFSLFLSAECHSEQTIQTNEQWNQQIDSVVNEKEIHRSCAKSLPLKGIIMFGATFSNYSWLRFNLNAENCFVQSNAVVNMKTYHQTHLQLDKLDCSIPNCCHIVMKYITARERGKCWSSPNLQFNQKSFDDLESNLWWIHLAKMILIAIVYELEHLFRPHIGLSTQNENMAICMLCGIKCE